MFNAITVIDKSMIYITDQHSCGTKSLYRQKVTTTVISSTSAELIGVSDMLDLLQCTHQLAEFIQARQKTPLTVYQDNTSTITIIIAYYMGRSSSHAKRRFIDIRYFCFKEHLEDQIC